MLTFYDTNCHKVGQAEWDEYYSILIDIVRRSIEFDRPSFCLFQSKDGIEFHVYKISRVDGYSVRPIV